MRKIEENTEADRLYERRGTRQTKLSRGPGKRREKGNKEKELDRDSTEEERENDERVSYLRK